MKPERLSRALLLGVTLAVAWACGGDPAASNDASTPTVVDLGAGPDAECIPQRAQPEQHQHRRAEEAEPDPHHVVAQQGGDAEMADAPAEPEPAAEAPAAEAPAAPAADAAAPAGPAGRADMSPRQSSITATRIRPVARRN